MSHSPRRKAPRILIVTPEITYLPPGMGNMAERMSAKAGGLADVSAALVSALHDQGADVHVALPNYRRMFNMEVFALHDQELQRYSQKLQKDRIHLAEDRLFYYREEVYSGYRDDSLRVALTFQREVINKISARRFGENILRHNICVRHAHGRDANLAQIPRRHRTFAEAHDFRLAAFADLADGFVG